VSAHKLAIQTIQKLSFTIYFRKSSNTRVPPPLEAPKVKFTVIWRMVQETTEEQTKSHNTKWVPRPWNKGQTQMLIQGWAVALPTLLWPTLICKTVPVTLLILMVPTLSSNNCIDKLYKYKSRFPN